MVYYSHDHYPEKCDNPNVKYKSTKKQEGYQQRDRYAYKYVFGVYHRRISLSKLIWTADIETASQSRPATYQYPALM